MLKYFQERGIKMKLLEIKNNLAKLSYSADENIALAGFITLKDENKSYIGQIVNLKADVATNYAIAKLIFNVNSEGIVDNYDGTIPTIKSNPEILNSRDILSLLPIEKPVALGKLAQQNTTINVDETIFEQNLTICAEKFENVSTIVKNATSQLSRYNEKIVVIDVDHTFGEFEPIRFKRDFKLPLNARMIDYIYKNDLSEVEAASKAVIQDIFYEVQEYTKTVKDNFIPFESFLNVVSQQYKQTGIPELALLKNKLLKYNEEQVFAQTSEDITSLHDAVKANAISYIDIANAPDTLQSELISYIHNVLNQGDEYIYMFVKLTNNNSDKQLLKQILDSEDIFTTIICSHRYKYLAELKQRAANIILFAPQTLQHDFASYNTFLNKLNAGEFIVYGELTQNTPFIVELTENPDFEEEYTSNDEEEDVVNNEEVETEPLFETIQEEADFEILPEEETSDDITFDFDTVEEEPVVVEDTIAEEPEDIVEPVQVTRDELIEQVAKDVDEVFYNKQEEIPAIEDITSEDTLTEDDLDLIDSFEEPVTEDVEEEIITETPIVEEIPTEFEVENEPVEQEEATFTLEEPVIEEEPEQIIPVYPAETPELTENAIEFAQGDTVSHPKYGKGVIEKLIKYGNKTLCSISFENVGRRLLDPAISELQKEA